MEKMFMVKDGWLTITMPEEMDHHKAEEIRGRGGRLSLDRKGFACHIRLFQYQIHGQLRNRRYRWEV